MTMLSDAKKGSKERACRLPQGVERWGGGVCVILARQWELCIIIIVVIINKSR